MKPRNPPSPWTRLAAGALLMLASGFAAAAPVVTYGSGGVATGINDLVVGGTAYDVSFVFGSYTFVYFPASPAFLGDHPGSETASDAIGVVLNGEAVSPTIGNGGPTGLVWVPYELTSSPTSGEPEFFASQVGYKPSSWRRFGDFLGSPSMDYTASNWAFATFAPASSVPEPATLALLGLALAALGFSRRRAAA